MEEHYRCDADGLVEVNVINLARDYANTFTARG